MQTSANSFGQFSAQYVPKIETALDQALAIRPHSLLVEAMRYSALSAGKRLRPLLVLMAADVVGGSSMAAMPAAVAIELIHVYSLVHDDLPSMDNDDLRRGKPTNHRVYGEAQAILAGDALQALAFKTVAIGLPPAAAQQCMVELADAAGVTGMCGGQSIDIAGLPAKTELADLQRMHALKTGALIRAAVRMGAITAEADSELLKALTIFGEQCGLAFQITDDILDVTGGQEIGKTPGKDAAQGKISYVSLLGLEGSRKAAENAVLQATTALESWSKQAAHLLDLAQYILTRSR